MKHIIAARYDADTKVHAHTFFDKYKIDVKWECRENPENKGTNVHYHAIIESELKITTIRAYRRTNDIIPRGQENMTFSEIQDEDQFLNYMHKGEFVAETGVGVKKKYIASTKSKPFITKIPSIKPVIESHNRYKRSDGVWSDEFYHNRFWDLMENLSRVIKIEKDSDGVNTVHKTKITGNEEFIKYIRKYTCYKTVKGNLSLIENITMDDIIEKIVDYYRLNKKDFDDIVIKKKLHLFYANVVRQADPPTYKQWIKSKSEMAINAGFIPPRCLKDEVEKHRTRNDPDEKDYLDE